MLAENLQKVQENIAAALAKRTEKKITGDHVTLVAVTKNHPAQVILDIEALQIGNIGENRVQEAKQKQEQIGHRGRWHLIGHLQTNKAKQAVALFDLIESVDSEKLLLTLDKEAEKQNRVLDILLQINVAQEPQKTGFAPAEYEAIVAKLDRFTHLRVRGLMIIAPQTQEEAVIREVFRQGYRYFCALQAQRPEVDCLSMGMSGDYPLAVEEGANIVRVGTGLFGQRDYSQRGY